MNKYEVMYVIDAALEDSARNDLISYFSGIVEKNAGTIDRVDEWGKRKLAYEINGLTDGDYTLVNFHADPQNVAELDRVLRINDAVVRHMIVKREDRD